MITEKEDLKNTALWWLSPMQRSGFIIYWLLILIFLISLISLFFIHVDLTIRARGVIRTVQAGEKICTISSGDKLTGECFISTKDIGQLKIGQQARLELDAFSDKYFGSLNACICSIDNDFIVMDKMAVFKVQCNLHDRIIRLPNGYSGEVKKGMSFQARFVVARRSIWQLLGQGLNDRLNPAHRIQ